MRALAPHNRTQPMYFAYTFIGACTHAPHRTAPECNAPPQSQHNTCNFAYTFIIAHLSIHELCICIFAGVLSIMIFHIWAIASNQNHQSSSLSQLGWQDNKRSDGGQTFSFKKPSEKPKVVIKSNSSRQFLCMNGNSVPYQSVSSFTCPLVFTVENFVLRIPHL